MMPRRSTVRSEIQQVRGGAWKTKRDVLAVEEPLEIQLSYEDQRKRVSESLSITMRTPGADFELAAGFLYGEQIVRAPGDIEEISYCVGRDKRRQRYNAVRVRLRAGVRFDLARLRRHFYTTSSCGVCGKASLEALQLRFRPSLPENRPLVSRAVLQGLPAKLRKAQILFEKTGGLHAAALFDPSGALLALREDVGRHNAVDKIVGHQLMERALPLHECVLMVSGRSSFEILQKALAAEVPVVAAVGAPSSLAVELAREFGLTLLGFVHAEGFNIYSGAQRIRSASD